MKKKDLIIKCQELNITNYNNKSKNELIDLDYLMIYLLLKIK